LEERQSGVCDIDIGPLRIRLLVMRDLADEPANAMLKLVSIAPEPIELACRRPVWPSALALDVPNRNRFQDCT
jgi:hypothetical protein